MQPSPGKSTRSGGDETDLDRPETVIPGLSESVSDGELTINSSSPNPRNAQQPTEADQVEQISGHANTDTVSNRTERSETNTADKTTADPAINDFHRKKLKTRREEWRINPRVASISAVSVVTVLALGAASYFYNSTAAAETFRFRAEEAAVAGDPSEESRWWSRYLMMVPDDADAIVRVAFSADQAADQAEDEKRPLAITNARKRLSKSLAELPNDRSSDQAEVRRRLIRRQLQSGGFWLREAERQVVLLDAPIDDVFANKALALALYGQVLSNVYDDRSQQAVPTENYWQWLASRNPVFAIKRAVQLAPNDLDVAAAFLGIARSNPELFLSPGDEQDKDKRELSSAEMEWMGLIGDTDSLVKQVGMNLGKMNSGRASLVLYYYGIGGSDDSQIIAQNLLLETGQKAAERLQDFDADEPSGAEEKPDGDQTGSHQLVLYRRLPPEVWDYQCLLTAARLAAGKAAGQVASNDQPAEAAENEKTKYSQLATQWYETLMAVSVPDVNASLRESTFLSAGLHADVSGDQARAIEIWRKGIDEVSTDNMQLSGTLAVRMADLADSDEKLTEAETAVQAFKNAIDDESSRLLLSTTRQLTQGQRNQLGRAIEMARWRYNVASAQLKIRRDRGTQMNAEAVEQLKNALASNAEVRPIERARIATVLGSLYKQQQVWDQAAVALSIASDLFPNDSTLNAQAGEAWAKAGNRERAADHWRAVGNSAALNVRLRAAQAEFDYQLRMPPAIRDLSVLRSTVEQIEREFTEGLSSAQGSAVNAEKIEPSLRILKMSLPPPGVVAEQHLGSRKFARFASALAGENTDNASLHAFAAGRLSAVGMNDDASQHLDRLEELLGENSTSLAMTKARIDAISGDSLSAAKRLLDQIENSPGDSEQLARLASAYALGSGDLNLSYESLQRIPEDRLSPNDLYRLFGQAKQLAVASDDVKATEQLEQEANDWRTGLKSLEESMSKGDSVQSEPNGTLWRMIELEEKLAELRKQAGQISRSDPRIVAAEEILDSILVQRPNWRVAISMQGYLSAIVAKHETTEFARKAKHQQAVEQLRAGIDAGDGSLRTRQLLLEELITLGRNDEADEVMKRMAMSIDFDVDPYAKKDIRSAVNRGDLLAAVQAARQSVNENPDNAITLTIFSRVASTAVQFEREKAAIGKGKSKLTEDQRTELIDGAREAIRKAIELSGDNSAAIAKAVLDIEFRLGTPESVDEAFKLIKTFALPEQEQLLLSAKVSLSKGDIDGAIEQLKKSDQIKPTAATQLQLAKLYQAHGQSVDLVESLRRAVKLQPENQKLKNELAKAIVVYGGDDADWDEVESLLRSGVHSTDNDKLLYAILLSAEKDNETQLLEALRLTRELVSDENATGYEASVVQVSVLVKLAEQIGDGGAENDLGRRDRYLDEARSVCQRLANARRAQAVDLTRYAAILLKYGSEKDLEKFKSLFDQLSEMPSGIFQSLDLGIAFIQRTDDSQDLLDWIENWAKDASEIHDQRLLGGVESAAGRKLMSLGFVEEGIDWHRKAYEANDNALGSYVSALAAAKKFQIAAKVCTAHYGKHGDTKSPTLLAEVLLATDSNSMSSEFFETLQDATEKHKRNAALLEGVATLAMQKNEMREAIKLYQQVLAIDPLRIRALNNLAMAYTQVPGLAIEGIVPIDRALKLTNRNPELLDTKGTILLKSGRNKEALKIFDEAFAARAEPRFQFHKILTLLRLNQQQEASKLWDTLDLESLNPQGLTGEERELLEQMKTDFESAAANQI